MSLIRRFSQRADRIADSRAPVDLDGGRPVSGVWEKSTEEFMGLLAKPAFTFSDVKAVYDLFRNSNTVGIDDRLMLLEKLIGLMARFKDHPESKKCQQFVLSLLYKDLPHPPSSYLTTLPLEVPFNPVPQGRIKYLYRTADGSYTNPLIPSLGRAGTPYARSVASSSVGPKSTLPDPGLVFDTLLKRDKFQPHPGGISSLFFAFADLVIHSIFNTRHNDWSINDSSSYLDLSILYGNNEADIERIRKNDGTGKLLEDVWADKRLTMMPPATCALLVLLSRNHNFVAQRLLDINENGKYTRTFSDDKQMKLQDDEIFHRSRLVNCGYFMQIILGDYVGAILGLARDGTDWRLNPLMTMRDAGHEFCPTGQGNVVSIEFNLLYRWHATLSQRDTTWISEFFDKVFAGKSPSKISVEDFKEVAEKRVAVDTHPSTWVFGNLKRDKTTNRFDDAQLADIIQTAIEERAGSFGARGIPECLRVIEMMGIEQSRSWGTCSLNEFRKFLGLKPYKTFHDWNPNPEIHKAAAALYRDIDNLELHVGLQAEEAKIPGPGAGLCPGFTISRAILADAVCLTRGDRFLTTEFNPYNLTAWGYQDCQFDPQDGSYGGLLTKLLFRTLPEYFPSGSAYAHFPFLDPKFMQPEMMRRDPDEAVKYTWTRPKPRSQAILIDDYASVETVLNNPAYLSSSDNRIFSTVKPFVVDKLEATVQRASSRFSDTKKRYSLSLSKSEPAVATVSEESTQAKAAKERLNAEEKAASDLEASKKKLTVGVASLTKSIFVKPEPDTAAYFSQKTVQLIAQKSFAKVGSNTRCVDIVKDVINLLPVYWISHLLGLPLKHTENPRGRFRESELSDMMADVACYVYLNFSPVDDWKLRESSSKTAEKIVEIIESHVDSVNSLFSIPDVLSPRVNDDNYYQSIIKKLWHQREKNCQPRELAAQLFATIIPSAALYSQALAHVVNFYLDADKKGARDELVKLINSGEKESLERALSYVYEALRLDPPVPGVYRTVARDATLQSTEVKAGAHIFASIVNANQDPHAFGPAPMSANFLGDTKHAITSFGISGLMTSEFFELTMLASLGKILALDTLQRGPGKSGVFIRFTEDLHGTPATKYINLRGLITPWADSLLVQFSQ